MESLCFNFLGDQFDDFDLHEKNLKASFFNWWMFSSFVGALSATLGHVYIQENLGWGLVYGIPTVGLLFSLFIFYLGIPIYRHKVRKTKVSLETWFEFPIAAFQNQQPIRTFMNLGCKLTLEVEKGRSITPQFSGVRGAATSQFIC
ncbi:Protein NRT1/ PTR FAMILY 5.2-like [Melia azedarach]|uniref:Protein NRT1/ PTR FAMILY 5.2-like n=1 Tax=Melia azedarach TaxID=155640 RepID=A0ACC1X839_MELAZ|nr:Protein NRT1/ PTR FAMILY 5.2-like [Melia azedarach]